MNLNGSGDWTVEHLTNSDALFYVNGVLIARLRPGRLGWSYRLHTQSQWQVAGPLERAQELAWRSWYFGEIMGGSTVA